MDEDFTYEDYPAHFPKDREDRVPREKSSGNMEQVRGMSIGPKKSMRKYKAYCKRMKARYERRKAKRNPEAPPTYGRFRGWGD